MSESERFVDNENDTISDTKFNLTWLKRDYYQIREKWCSWNGAHKFVAKLNEKKYAGYDDWRLPTTKEARNLYDHECKNYDFDDDIVHIDYLFPEGCGSTYWCSNDSGHMAAAYNFYSDRGYNVRKNAKDEGNMTCRPVRSSGPRVTISDRTSGSGRTLRG
jgi:hypothetical protein